MIGKLIPAGTGMKRYKNIELDYGVNAEIMESYERQKELEAMEAVEEDIIPEAEHYEETVEAMLNADIPETPYIIEID